MKWIDTHVHLFSENKGNNEGMPRLKGEQLNTADNYLSLLSNNKPEAIVVVDFSKAPNSEHVINSLDELNEKQVPAAGIINGDIKNEKTFEWIQRPDVKGIRLYAKTSVPDFEADKQRWDELFSIVRQNNKHILVFGSGEYLLQLVKKLPTDITIVVDHLGLPDVFNEEGDRNFSQLLNEAKERQNVYFKGPGYRTSLNAETVRPAVKAIIDAVGVNKVMLGASDGPFAGPVLDPAPEYEGKKFIEVMDYNKVLEFTSSLAETANDDNAKDKLLYSNAKDLYGF